ncbi:hypothetical protein [Aeoliella sp.]
MTRLVDTSTTQMGSVLVDGGVTFRVWTPNADRVCVIGDFNAWSPEAHPL